MIEFGHVEPDASFLIAEQEFRQSFRQFRFSHPGGADEEKRPLGHTLLLAVPGSGKTTTLVARLGYMIYEKHIEPENILVLTYTVAATKDMSERFVKVFGDEMKDRLEFRTINGVCAKIILHYSHIINKPAFRLEADEKKRALRISQIYQKIVEDFPTESEIREITTFSTYVTNMMLTEEEIKKQGKD